MSKPRAGLNELDPAVQDALRLERFTGKFSVKDFVETISGPSLALTRANPKEFDPKPYIRTFESSMEEILRLRRKILRQTDDLEDACKATEGGHNKKMAELNRTFEDVYHSFENLETRINEVGNTAIRIGEQLETIDKQRSRAAEAKDLIVLFGEFSKGGSPRLESMRRGSTEEQYKAATIARRLNTLVRDVDLPGTEAARAGIEKYCEDLERDLLADFDAAYRAGNFPAMSHCARTLFEFNGGQSCVQTYVNQHEFFISKLKINESEDLSINTAALSELGNPNCNAPPPDKGLLKLCDEIYETVRHEWSIISTVFPKPLTVMQVFVQRVFAQSLQNYLESIISRAESQSNLAYLRVLAASHVSAAALVDELKKFDRDQIQSSLVEQRKVQGVGAENNGQHPSASLSSKISQQGGLSDILDHCMKDLFVPYLDGDRYIEPEKKALLESFNIVLSAFNSFQTQRRATARNRNLLSRTVAQVQSASNPSTPTTPSGSKKAETFLTPTSSSGPNLAAGAARFINMVSGGGPQLAMEDGLLDPRVCLRLERAQAEAISRCVEASTPTDLPRNATILFRTFLDYIGSMYLDIALDAALEDVTPSDNKTEPYVASFPSIQQANNILQLIQLHYQAVMTPLTSTSPTRQREVALDMTTFLARFEKKINATVQAEVDAIMNWLSVILSRQKKNDFKPKDDEVSVVKLETQPCMQCVDFLMKVYNNTKGFLDAENLNGFLTEIGVGFHSMLLDHFKRFSVSPSGGIVLMKDIAKYQEVIALFKIPALNERFEFLRQLGNVFVVKPAILKSLFEEGYLAKIDQRSILPFLQMRSDYKSGRIESILLSSDTGGPSR